MAIARGAGRVHVDGHRAQVDQVMGNLVLDLRGDSMALSYRQVRGHGDIQVGVKLVAGPAHSDVGDRHDATDVLSGVGDLINNAGVNPVQQPPENQGRRLPNDPKNKGRDDEGDDRVGDGPAQPEGAGAQGYAKAREAVDAGVVAIGHQRGAPDLPANPQSKKGHGFVGGEPHDARPGQGPKELDLTRIEEPVYGRVSREQTTAQNYQDDEDTRQVLHPPIPVGEAAAGPALGEPEGDPKGNGGRRVAEIMDRVREQRDASGEQDDRYLDGCGCKEHEEGPLDGPYTPS